MMIMTWQKFKGNSNRMHQFGGPMILKSSGHWLCMRIVHWLMFKLCFVSSVKIPLCIQTEAEKQKLVYKVVQQFMKRCTKRIKRRISISLTAITKCVNHYRIHFAFNEVNRNLVPNYWSTQSYRSRQRYNWAVVCHATCCKYDLLKKLIVVWTFVGDVKRLMKCDNQLPPVYFRNDNSFAYDDKYGKRWYFFMQLQRYDWSLYEQYLIFRNLMNFGKKPCFS